jgi:hypothetical protein
VEEIRKQSHEDTLEIVVILHQGEEVDLWILLEHRVGEVFRYFDRSKGQKVPEVLVIRRIEWNLVVVI